MSPAEVPGLPRHNSHPEIPRGSVVGGWTTLDPRLAVAIVARHPGTSAGDITFAEDETSIDMRLAVTMLPSSQIARELDGAHTDVLLQAFADRILVLITQIGKVGTLVSVL